MHPAGDRERRQTDDPPCRSRLSEKVAILPKPFTPALLTERVRALLDHP
jgi:hypothetical protein